MEMTNLERLVAAKIMYADSKLTPEQREAIENLTEAEVDALISVKNKIANVFPPVGTVPPVQHHN